jgi:hypothetical protein
MKKIYLALFAFVCMLFLAWMIIKYDNELNKNYACVKQKEFKLEKWNEVVIEKYTDSSNHNAETIKFYSQTTYAMFRDETDFFKFIETGDSVVKVINTDSIKVFRNGIMHCFIVDFGCSEND